MKVLCVAAICLAGAAQADIEMRFIEGAPKDAFVLTALGGCAVGPMEIALDLSGSDAGLVFDVTEAGAGVQVFQPFELVSGRDLVQQLPEVRDGDQALVLALSGLPVGAPVRFTIDLDDTKGARGITVSGSEIAGATVRVTQAGVRYDGVFGTDARARVALPGCGS